MKTPRFLLCLMTILSAPAVFGAEVVRKVPINTYSRLWNNSPFTTKPDVVGPPVEDPFKDLALSAVSPVDGGYMVILQNKKKPDERIKIVPGQPSEYKVVDVRAGNSGARSATVMLSNGSKSGLVSFDEKLLVIKAAPALKPGVPNGNPGAPGAPGGPVAVPIPGANPVAAGVPNTNVPNPGNPGGGFPHQGGGNNGGNNGGGNAGAVNGAAAAGGVRPPRPRVVPSQGGNR